MNLTQLQFVQAIAETGSFSRAAERCFVTQPTLSNAVAHLEDELGGRLFSRTTRKVGLTPLGEHLLPFIRSALGAIDDLLQSAKLYKSPSHKLIRIGFSPLINTRLLAAIMEPFQRFHPDVEIIFKECFLNDLWERLDQHAIDVAFLPRNPKKQQLSRCLFYEEELYFVPCNNLVVPLHKGGPFHIKDVTSQTFVLTIGGCGLADAVRKLFKTRGIRLREYRGQALSYQIAEEWAELGIGAAILPKSKISSKNQNARPLLLDREKPAKLIYNMMWCQTTPRSEHLSDFLTHFKKVAPTLTAGMAQ